MYVWLCMKKKANPPELLWPALWATLHPELRPSGANSAQLYPLSHLQLLKCINTEVTAPHLCSPSTWETETGTESSRPVWSYVVRPCQSVWHLVGAQKAFVKHLSCIMNLFPVPPASFQHRLLRIGFSVPALCWPQASHSGSSSWALVLLVTVVALALYHPVL